MPKLPVTLTAPLLFLLPAAHAQIPSDQITQQELVRRTQELYDAVALGNKEPWKQYFADDVLFFDEKGRSMDKPALIDDIAPLPTGYSGTIKVVRPQSRILGHIAILSYDLDETETIYGQHMTARYHVTDTWMFRDGRWQIVASQAFRYYEDPAPGKINPARLDDYVGTYQLAPGVTLTISREGDNLYTKRTDRPKAMLVPESPDLFFLPGAEGRRLFHRDDSGKVDTLIDRRNNEDVVWKKSD